MTTENSKATTQLQVKQKTAIDWLKEAGLKEQIKAALPKHMTADRMLRVSLTELRKNPKLQQCCPLSFIGSIIQCSQLGLEPGGHLGHVYLVPFENKKKSTWEIQIILGYKGMIELATRSGKVNSPQAQVVCENDIFEFEYGLTPKLRHIPARANRGKLIYAYARIFLKDGGSQYEVMSIEEINRIKGRSKTSNSGPWQTDYEEMAKKTVFRRLFKYLPVSIEMVDALALDEAGDFGQQQNENLEFPAFEAPKSYAKKSDMLFEKLKEAEPSTHQPLEFADLENNETVGAQHNIVTEPDASEFSQTNVMKYGSITIPNVGTASNEELNDELPL
jgi:recombination protein RecT